MALNFIVVYRAVMRDIHSRIFTATQQCAIRARIGHIELAPSDLVDFSALKHPHKTGERRFLGYLIREGAASCIVGIPGTRFKL